MDTIDGVMHFCSPSDWLEKPVSVRAFPEMIDSNRRRRPTLKVGESFIRSSDGMKGENPQGPCSFAARGEPPLSHTPAATTHCLITGLESMRTRDCLLKLLNW